MHSTTIYTTHHDYSLHTLFITKYPTLSTSLYTPSSLPPCLCRFNSRQRSSVFRPCTGIDPRPFPFLATGQLSKRKGKKIASTPNQSYLGRVQLHSVFLLDSICHAVAGSHTFFFFFGEGGLTYLVGFSGQILAHAMV